MEGGLAVTTLLDGWWVSLKGGNLVTAGLTLVLVLSLLQGFRGGFFRSGGKLLGLLGLWLLTAAALLIALPVAAYLSPIIQRWAAGIAIPGEKLEWWRQLYYMTVSLLADSPALRFLALLAVGYFIIRLLLALLLAPLVPALLPFAKRARPGAPSWTSRLGGAAVGLCLGLARCLLIVAAIFLFASLKPEHGFSRYAETSPLYSQSAAALLEPLAGEALHTRLPVLTETISAEMGDILRRRYEVIDNQVPDDIAGAAAEIAGGASGDEEKARLLYDWVGSRIVYDYDKADKYIQQGIWKEQTPQDTFDTRLGVCIDYARLYAVMARSQGLEVRVVTGLGYDGRGGYGSHAWNEVFVGEREAWIPLDPTWAGSGNWFNPPDFDETHIKETVL